jgi:hypothetical protein
VIGTIELPFESTQGSYGTKNTYAYGEGEWALTLAEDGVPMEMLGVVFGEYEGIGYWFATGRFQDGTNGGIYGYTVRPELLREPGTIEMDWSSGLSYLVLDQAGDLRDWEIAAYLAGSLTLTVAGSAYEDPLVGSFSLEIMGGGG